MSGSGEDVTNAAATPAEREAMPCEVDPDAVIAAGASSIRPPSSETGANPAGTAIRTLVIGPWRCGQTSASNPPSEASRPRAGTTRQAVRSDWAVFPFPAILPGANPAAAMA